ncbi:MAG: glycosyltransferase [Pyrinomonadaceae bacterium]|nr:glycosyltransferase [Pyrinomonadaceae bacterium]
MNKPLRVAFFPDSYLEVNGAAMTSQRLVGYAKQNGYPFLCVHADKKTGVSQDESVTFLTLKRSPVSFKLDEDLAYDPFFQRHATRVLREMVKFKPDVIHITGINDISIVGVYLGWKMQIPVLGSWHTNVHEFAAHRLAKMFRFLPASFVSKITNFAERKILDGTTLFYKIPKVILAPNQELIDLLAKSTGRKAFLMSRGVDTETFSPTKRTVSDDVFRFGFVGRLRAEKNVRLLPDLEKKLLEAGKTNFKFLVVGEGSERGFLEKNMSRVEVTGFLDGERLSEAYANMDVFVFPSETETFGNVVQEANSSGVPAIVTNQGGPKFIVRHDETGFVAENFGEFVKYALELMNNPPKLLEMKKRSREVALSRSWDAVFEKVYRAYDECWRIQQEELNSSGGNSSK